MLEARFPALKNTGYAITSPETPFFNCISWAAGDTTRFWWPHDGGYWPQGIPRKRTVEVFVQAFATLGYADSNTTEREPGKQKVALYAKKARPEHAARQLPSGMWTSKLGQSVDIAHTLEGLEGKKYGKVVRVLERPLDEQS